MPDHLNLSRRSLLASAAAGAIGVYPGLSAAAPTTSPAPTRAMPTFLQGREAAFQADPRKAMIDWFRQARYGLFLHYGLYSILGRGEWVMLRDKVPMAEYEKLKDRFTADRFNAEAICDLAIAAGMKYVNITARHHDGFCLFKTATTDYQVLNSPAKRDLVGELAAACRKKGLALFLYYSYGLDWHHPYFFPIEAGCKDARPAYAKPEPRYLWRKDEDFRIYIDYANTQMRELVTQYRPAGLWLDPEMCYFARPELFPVSQSYRMVRELDPACLLSFKQGATGEEDFAAPEHEPAGLDKSGELARKAWRANQGKPMEICSTMQDGGWGYVAEHDGKHKKAPEVLEMVRTAWAVPANLLLNTGPLPDGSILPEDERTLREVGAKLRADWSAK